MTTLLAIAEGQTWRHKNGHRTLRIVEVRERWDGALDIYPERSTSRRTQRISEATLRQKYRLVAQAPK